MTILTKPFSEKKADKLGAPLVSNEQQRDLEATAPPEELLIINRSRAGKISATLCVLLTSLMVVSIGIVGGTFLYRQYVRAKMHRFRCVIPYDDARGTMFMDEYGGPIQEMPESLMSMPGYFHEEVELDLEEERYEKITVPDFRDDRRGRFVHDFSANKTAIIDMEGRRCFVLPLNTTNVIPPRSMQDLLYKVWAGHYQVDTQVVRETMRVVTPPLTDTKEVGVYIKENCKDFPIYKLEKIEQKVRKRSADLSGGAKFAGFAGKNIIEFDIVNLAEAEEFEQRQLLRN